MMDRDVHRVIGTHVITMGVTCWVILQVFELPKLLLLEAEQEVLHGNASQKTTV